MPRKCVDITGEPQARKRDPRNVVDCQFSAHLCIAAALVNGRLGFDDYEPALADPRVRGLMQRIDCHVESRAEAEYPKSFPGLVEIRLKDGTRLERWVRVPSGEPDTMLTPAQMRAKFSSLVTDVLGADGEARLFEAIMRLAEPRPVAELMAAAQPA